MWSVELGFNQEYEVCTDSDFADNANVFANFIFSTISQLIFQQIRGYYTMNFALYFSALENINISCWVGFLVFLMHVEHIQKFHHLLLKGYHVIPYWLTLVGYSASLVVLCTTLVTFLATLVCN